MAMAMTEYIAIAYKYIIQTREMYIDCSVQFKM